MGKILTSILCVILAVYFTMAVFTNGTNMRYSLWDHFNRVAVTFKSTPSFQELTTYWTEEKFWVTILYGDDKGTSQFVYPEEIGSGDDAWVLQPVIDFFGAVKGFFLRCYYSVVWVCGFVVTFFEIVYVLLPWNGLTEVPS